jgi:hypothetical protein
MKKVEFKRMNPPRGFFTRKGQPTMKSVECYVIYLSLGGDPTKDRSIPKWIVAKIREYFGYEDGFECIMNWGLNAGCGTSKTSSGRYYAMNEALRMAQSMYPRVVIE